ncbi:MAG: M56 family metallopeptidase [Evtepia sp.]
MPWLCGCSARENGWRSGSFLPVYRDRCHPSPPCLFGLIRPTIYLTPDVVEDEKRNAAPCPGPRGDALPHGDLIWSLLRGVCLAAHWFDALVWWAAILSRRDSETACDAGTLRRLGESPNGWPADGPRWP